MANNFEVTFNLGDPNNGTLLIQQIQTAVNNGTISVNDLAKLFTMSVNKNNQYFTGTSDGTIVSGTLNGDILSLTRNLGPIVNIPVNLATNTTIVELAARVTVLEGGGFAGDISALDARITALENTPPYTEVDLILNGLTVSVAYAGSVNPTLSGDKENGWVITEPAGCYLIMLSAHVTSSLTNSGSGDFIITVDNNSTIKYKKSEPEIYDRNSDDWIEKDDYGITTDMQEVAAGETKYTSANLNTFGATGVDYVLNFR